MNIVILIMAQSRGQYEADIANSWSVAIFGIPQQKIFEIPPENFW